MTTVSAIVDTVAQAGNDGRHQYLAVLLGQSEYVRQAPKDHITSDYHTTL